MNLYEIINKLTDSYYVVPHDLFNIDDLPIDLIRYLYLNNKKLHGKIARYKNTPVDILVDLSHFTNELEVRWGLAENINIPIDLLIKLSTDKSYEVRNSVAKHPNTPIDIAINILIELSQHTDSHYRVLAASNNNTPLDILIKLTYDHDERVYVRAKHNRVRRLKLFK